MVAPATVVLAVPPCYNYSLYYSSHHIRNVLLADFVYDVILLLCSVLVTSIACVSVLGDGSSSVALPEVSTIVSPVKGFFLGSRSLP